MKHRREILAIALPAIVSNLTTPILGLVDVAVTGHIGDAVYIGAIAVGSTIFNMLYWLFGFLRMGSSGLTAQAYGAKDTRRMALVFYRALLIALAIGILLIILSRPIADLALRFMEADDTTDSLAKRYFTICIWGAPAVMINYVVAGWFIGMQDSKAAMWVAVTTNVLNICVSVALVFGLGWKIEGVATGTMSAQWVGAVLALLIVFNRYRPVAPSFVRIIQRSEIVAFFRINVDIFLRTCCLVAVTVWFTHAGALQGTQVLAANALLLQLFLLFSYFIDGFAYAGEALAGKYEGAGDGSRLKSVVGSLHKTGLICALVFMVSYYLCGALFLDLLAEDGMVVALAVRYLPWAVAVPLCGFSAFVWDGIFIGLVATRQMLLAMLSAVAVFFVFYFALTPIFANDALWLAFNSYLLFRGIAQRFFYHRWIRIRR